MYDLLVSADIVADDPDRWAGLFTAALDLPVPRPRAFLEPDGHGFRAAWVRVRPSLGESPTRVELIGARPRTAPHDYVQERIEAQGDRPVRTHATVLAGDIDAILERIRDCGVRHRITPPGPDFPFRRLWIGVSDDEPTVYLPETDAGLWLEVVPTAYCGVPVEAVAATERADVPGVRRVASRRFLVSDLTTSLNQLETGLGLVPAEVFGHDDVDVASFAFNASNSATLELVGPRDHTSELGGYLAEHGPGPHAVVLGVGDLDMCAVTLAERGLVSRRAAHWPGDDRLVVVDDIACGVPVELVCDEPVASTQDTATRMKSSGGAGLIAGGRMLKKMSTNGVDRKDGSQWT